VDQFAAYARGMLAGGVAERFLQQVLEQNKRRADVDAAAVILTRRMPDAEAELFAPLAARYARFLPRPALTWRCRRPARDGRCAD